MPMIRKYYLSLYLIGSKGQVKFFDEFLLNRELHPFFFFLIEKRIRVSSDSGKEGTLVSHI